MAFPLVQLFEEAAAVAGEIKVEIAELEAGQTIDVPFEPQVGSVGGKPVYLRSTLSTTKETSHPSPATASAHTEAGGGTT